MSDTHHGSYRVRQKALTFFQYVFAVLITIIIIFPLYWMVISSFKSTEELLLSTPTLFPKEFHFENYTAVFTKFPMWGFMLNTFIVTISTTILQTVVGILAAYSFSKGNYWGRDLLFVLVLGALMIPIQITFIPIYIMVSHAGWLNTYVGLILPEAVSAYFIFMLRQSFKSVDESYLDAARVDGMGRVGMITHVLVPMCKPTVVTVTVIAFINGWNSYFWPKMVTTNNTHRTISIALKEILNSYAGIEIMNFNQIMAASLVCILPVMLLFLMCQKYILTGLSKAAMK